MRLLKIGRDQSCDITLNSSKVSSLHAELTLLNSGDILLEDKGSMNGTFVMNHPIKPGKAINVRRGDAIRFADVELQWGQVPIEDNTGYKAVWGIGSDFHNEFQVSGSTVSRFHATIKQATDGKFYIFDHSKNGTTVDGRKIMPNNPYRIKKKSAIACGGVPVDLVKGPVKLPWPSELWKVAVAAAACIVLIVGIGVGVKKWSEKQENDKQLVALATAVAQQKEFSDQELYNKYNHSLVMLMGIYHYEVKIGGLSKKDWQIINKWLVDAGQEIPEKFVYLATSNGVQMLPVNGIDDRDYVDYVMKLTNGEGLSTATGFFISEDGKLLTNLHVVKPWLFDSKEVQEERVKIVQIRLANVAQKHMNDPLYPILMACMTDVKVEGQLDKLALISQGETFDPNTIQNCRVLSAGNDMNKDVALIQIAGKRLPTSDCTFVDVNEVLETSSDSIYVGNHMYTMGFPLGFTMQDEAREDGIKVISQNGTISQIKEFDFMHNASTTGGMSGSPIFNKWGKLIGVHHAGYSQSGLQGFNYGVKAKYIKELLDSPYKK